MKDIRIPTCMDCPCRLDYEGSIGQIRDGTRMKPFERYCTATKRPKLIRKGYMIRKPPSWCPKRKDPCEVRVFGFASDEAEQIHYFHAATSGKVSPQEHRYKPVFTGTIPLTPREFWRRCHEYGADLGLPTKVELYQVVEIDDGLKPVCFYLTPNGYQMETLFDPNKTKKE